MNFIYILICYCFNLRGHRGRDRMVVPITTKVVNLNPAHGKVYSIQHYVIKSVSDFMAGEWFSLGTPVSSINKTDRNDTTERLLKVMLNTITLILF